MTKTPSRKIFITGCAKTGTTLVRRLFNAFDLVVYNKNEMYLQQFLDREVDVAKRRWNTLFSHKITDEQEQYEKMKDVNIVNVVRNKADVLKSTNGYVPEARYDECQRHVEKYGDVIDYTIDYEDLIKDPDKIQKEVAEKFNLTIKHKWTEYPDFIDIEDEQPAFKTDKYQLRRIGI